VEGRSLSKKGQRGNIGSQVAVAQSMAPGGKHDRKRFSYPKGKKLRVEGAYRDFFWIMERGTTNENRESQKERGKFLVTPIRKERYLRVGIETA